MQLTAAQNLQNRGTFHVADTALKSGNSHSDRHSGGETYMAFQHTDSLQFQRWMTQAEVPTTEDQIVAFCSLLLSLDIRVYTSLAVSLVFAMVFHAVFEPHALMTLVTGTVFFFVWYVMSFFDFQRLMKTLSYGGVA